MGHHIAINPHNKSQVDDGKVFQIGGPTDILDFAVLNNAVYGFYTMRDIEITAIECIVTEAMMCVAQAGEAYLIDDSLNVYAIVTAVDNTAVNDHMSGVPAAGAVCRVKKGTMLYMKTITQNLEGGSETGQGYFHIEYR